MPSYGNCSTATCRSRRWPNSSCRRTKPRRDRSHLRHDQRRKTEDGVDGTYARRSAAASRSSPAAAQRCATGAGLDGGDRGRSIIKGAERRATRTSLHRRHGSDRLFDYITSLHQLDGRDRDACANPHRLWTLATP